MFRSKKNSNKTFVQILMVVLALTATPKLLTPSMLDPVLAQSNSPSPSFPLPESLPSGTTVKVDGSSSMRVINEALKKRYEEKFSGTKVDLASGGTDGALAALQRGDINLAAVGRPLTDQEKDLGLVFVPLSREKIAIIVGSDNPFKQNLTFEQFAKMFRGEITDWSQLGGAPGKIRFIDHPEWGDTRRSLSTYEIFKKAPFKNGASTTRLSQDDTASIVRELGKDGISYAIADQVLNLPSVRVIPMHKTMPDDPRYPYSQPRGYVYRKETTAPAMLAFLGFATSAPGKEIVAAAKQQEVEAVRQSTTTTAPVAASPSPAATTPVPAPTAQTALVPASTSEANRGFPWWLLLLGIPLLGLLWWFLKGGRGRTVAIEDTATPRTTPTVSPGTTEPITTAPRAIDTNRTSEIPASPRITEIDTTPPSTIGTATHDTIGNPPTETPVTPVGFGINPATGLGIAQNTAGAVAGGAARDSQSIASRITLEPRSNSREAYAVWSAPPAHREAAKQRGGQQFQLRIYDATGINLDRQPAHSMQSYDCDELSTERIVPIERSDRDYVAEIGYVTPSGQWLILASSNPVRLHCPGEPIQEMTGYPVALETPFTTASEPAASPSVEHPAHQVEQTIATARAVAVQASVPEAEIHSRVVLTAGNNQSVSAQWEVSHADQEAALQSGRRQFQLRIYDVTDYNSMQSYDCDELSQWRQVSVPVGDRDYIAEIGYYTTDGQWLILARSNSVLVPSTSEPVQGMAGETPFALETPLTTASEPNKLTEDVPDPDMATPGLAGFVTTGAVGAIASGAAWAWRSRLGRITLEQSNSTEAYAQWSVPAADQEAAKQQGGRIFQLRIYDVTDIDLDTQQAHSMQSYNCDELSTERRVLILRSDRDYVAEIGYATPSDRWLILARSLPVRIATSPSTEHPVAQVEQTIATARAVAVQASTPTARTHSRVVLTVGNNQIVFAQWETSHTDQAAALQSGGRQFQLRIYDVTDYNSMQSYDCDVSSQSRLLSVPVGDRDYIAEIGYYTTDGQWLILARSNSVRVPSTSEPVQGRTGEIASPPPEVATLEPNKLSDDVPLDQATPGVPGVIATGAVVAIAVGARWAGRRGSRITLVPRNSTEAYAQWSVPAADREAAKDLGGRIFQLRIYDVTDIDLDTQQAHSMQSYNCDELSTERRVLILRSDRDYVAEIGYATPEGQWLILARSNPVLVDSTSGTEKIGAQIPLTTALEPTFEVEQSSVTRRSGCKVQHLTVHSRNHCFRLDDERMRKLQETAVTKTLEPGTYVVRLKSGTFGNGTVSHTNQPIVMLWIYGGIVVNKKTNVPVPATWSSLNGYDDTLTLEVMETATLCAFFFDTYADDNQEEVIVSVIKLYSNDSEKVTPGSRSVAVAGWSAQALEQRKENITPAIQPPSNYNYIQNSFDSFRRDPQTDTVCVTPIRTIVRREEEITLIRKLRKIEQADTNLACPINTVQSQQQAGQNDISSVESKRTTNQTKFRGE